jgi:hypothetical protein
MRGQFVYHTSFQFTFTVFIFVFSKVVSLTFVFERSPGEQAVGSPLFFVWLAIIASFSSIVAHHRTGGDGGLGEHQARPPG